MAQNEQIRQQVLEFFSGWPTELGLFEGLSAMIEEIGPAKLEVQKTQIAFGTRRKFAWAWMPTEWARANRPGNPLIVSFSLGRRVEHQRIVEWVEARPGRFTHHVVVHGPEELDGQLREWLEEAYASSK